MKAEKFPVHMDVELSAKCNLRCRFCHLSSFTPKSTDQFSLARFKEKIGPALPHLKSITLFNKYEPLTCRDFVGIFKFLSKFEIETYFSTNGLLLSGEIIDALTAKLTYLTVSVTGFTPETYKMNMGFNGLDRLKENLSKLNDLKKERKTRYPRLRISTVGMLDALDELGAAVDFAERYNAEEGIQLTSFKAHEKDLVSLMPMNDRETYTELTAHALTYAAERGVKLVLQSGSLDENERKTTSLGHRFCDLPWHRLSVQPNGDVYPCPMAYDPIGNLDEEIIGDIWESEALKAFRASVNDPDHMNRDCINCTHCRHRSLTRPEVNDYSDAETYPTGLTRTARAV